MPLKRNLKTPTRSSFGILRPPIFHPKKFEGPPISPPPPPPPSNLNYDWSLRTKTTAYLLKNKSALTVGFSLACFEVRSRKRRRLILHETAFTRWRFLLPTLSTLILFICFWTDLVRALATTRNTSAVVCLNTRKFKGFWRFQRRYIIARDQKSDLHGTSFPSWPKINRMLLTRGICIQWKFTTPDHLSFAN